MSISNFVQVAVGILFSEGRILLCQRKPDARYGLKWEFPGGKLEPGENFREALARELFEELSIEISGGEVIHAQESHFSDGGKFRVEFFLIRDFSGSPRNNVFHALEWVRPEDLLLYDILEGNREICELLPGLLRG